MAVKSNAEASEWRCRDRVIYPGSRALIMGILNVTPDSFSDGGVYNDPVKAVHRALELVHDGADILDVGGESTRPGADAVDACTELERVIPVIRALRAQSDVLISVDTCKAEVARQAMDAGAQIINDVSACTRDPAMLEVARDSGAGLVLMHMAGNPQTMQQAPQYAHVVDEVVDYLKSRMEACRRHGIDERRIILDPGIGFGKTQEHNLELLANLPVLCRLGRPVLIGVSRKSLVGYLTGRSVEQRLAGSLAVAACALERGAQLLRVHDVKETCDVAKVVNRIRSTQSCGHDGFGLT